MWFSPDCTQPNDAYDSSIKKGRSDDIVIPFLNLINDAYCRDISIKIRSQLDVKRKKGDFIGAFAVYGYKRDERNRNKLVIDERSANVVKLIFQWKLEGQSAEGIANKLNSLGIYSPMAYKRSKGFKYSTPFAQSSDTKWSAVAVTRILKNETYTGMLIQGKAGTPNHKIKKKFQKPVSDWARVNGTHEPIISSEDYNLVARLLACDTRTSPGVETVYPFSGIAKCGVCGENMIRKTSHSNGKAYIYFVCCHQCKGSRISESLLAECVKAALQSHINSIMNLGRVLRFTDDLPLKQDEVIKLEGQITAKRAEMERYERLIFSLYENLQRGVIKESNYTMMHTHYTALYSEAERAINSLNREIDENLSNSGWRNHWLKRFREYQDFAEITRHMVVSLIDIITIHPGTRLDIIFRYRYDYEQYVSFVQAPGQIYPLTETAATKDVV